MAERDRYDWDRGREFDDRRREYGRDRDRQRSFEERGMMTRGADEVRSWFGDDEARHRREIDERRHERFSSRDHDYGPNSHQVRREHGWSSQGHRPDSPWERGHDSRTAYGDQRDFIGRSPDWDERQYSPRGREWDDPGYGPGSAQWSGGARDYGDEDNPRRFGNSRYASGTGFSTTGEGRWRGEATGSSSNAGWPSESGRFSGRGPRNYQRSDERIREDVNERLTADPRIDASDIDVRVQNGEVTLSGTVDDRRTRRLAEEIVEDLPGVRDVRIELKCDANRWGQSGSHQGDQSRAREEGIGASDLQKRDEGTTTTRDAGKR